MKILHTADLHIEKENDLTILEMITGIAENENCDHLFIAGDMFEDGRSAGILAASAARLLTKFTGKVWIIPGNHDENLPEVLHIFNGKVFDDIALVDLGEDFDLLAIPYTEGSLTDLISENALPDSEKTVIAMMHGTLYKEDLFFSDMESNEYFPIKFDKLEELDFYYTALGHYHSYYEHVTENGIIVNPGSPIATRKSDLGRRTVAIFDTETASVKKVLLDIPYYQEICIDINFMMGYDAVLALVHNQIMQLEADRENDFRYLMLHVVIKGHISMNQEEQIHLESSIGDLLNERSIQHTISAIQLKTIDRKFLKDPAVISILEQEDDEEYTHFALSVLSDIYSNEL